MHTVLCICHETVTYGGGLTCTRGVFTLNHVSLQLFNG